MCTAVNGQQVKHDGTMWLNTPREQKSAYVMGMLDGIRGADVLLPEATQARVDAYLRRVGEALGKSTVGELVGGLDEFYKDFRNRNVPIYRAIIVVGMQINGEPESKIEQLTKALRASPDGD
jgi:hypothetical protein